MARAFTPKVLTANRLIEGDVVYLGPNDEWVLYHDQAVLLDDEVIANEQLAVAQTQADVLVGAYLADAVLENGKPVPTHFRETFRTLGPSNYVHGKQETHNV